MFQIMDKIENSLNIFFNKSNPTLLSNINKHEIAAKYVQDCISQNIYGYDLLFSLFAVSVRSYRRSSVCDPFPPILYNFPKSIIDEMLLIPSFNRINYIFLSKF